MKRLSKRIFKVFVLCPVLLIGVVLMSGCSTSATTSNESQTIIPDDSPQLPIRGFFMGILPTTAQGQSLDDAYAQAARYSEFVPVWGRPTPFYNLAADLSGSWGQTFVKQLIRGNNMFPIINLTFMGSNLTLAVPPGMENATLSDPEWRTAYKQATLDVVRASHPLYLSVGNEVNRWYEKYGNDGPNGFKNYVSLYEEIYDAVKKLSPQTRVFCIFAREIVDEQREADLSVLKLFNPDKMDMLIFTSYPYIIPGRNDPSMIPDNYYSEAANYMPGKQFGFSEITWIADSHFGGEPAQANFITQVTSRLTRDKGVNLYMFGWFMLHDLASSNPVGLITINGIERQGYQVWKNISGR